MTVSSINGIAFTSLSAIDGRTLSTLTAVNGQTIAAVPSPEVEFDGRNLSGANNDPITTWVDSSGNGRDATSAGAGTIQNNVLNGHPVSRWTGGAGNGLDFTGNAVTDVFTVIAVAKCTDSNNRTILAEGTGGDGPPRFAIDTNKIWLAEDDDGATVMTASTSLSTSTFYTVAVTWDGSSNAFNFYLNGSGDGSGTNASASYTRRFSRIGMRSGNQNTFNGDIAYVAYWNSVLSGSELTAVFDDLRTVWAHY